MQVARLVRKGHNGHARGVLQVVRCASVVSREEGQLDGLVYTGLPLARLAWCWLGPIGLQNGIEFGSEWARIGLKIGPKMGLILGRWAHHKK